MWKICKKRRDLRFKNGALEHRESELFVKINRKTKEPIELGVEEQMDSKKLIEYLMITANCVVAKRIFEKAKNVSVLRKHAGLDQSKCEDLKKWQEKQDIFL